MTPEEFQQRYASLLEHYGELIAEQSPDKLYDSWRWFQSATMSLLYEYNESSMNEEKQ